MKSISTVSLWAENHIKPIVLADIPMIYNKYNIINSYPLLELESIFEKVAFNSYLHNKPMAESAIELFPDIILH